MKKLLLVLLLIPNVAFAQQQPTSTPPTTFTLTVTQEDLQIIGNALEELPFRKSAPIVNKLNTQIQNQMTPKPPVPAPTPKPAE